MVKKGLPGRQTDKLINRWMNKQRTKGWIDRQMGREAEGRDGRQTGRQIVGQNKWKDRWADRLKGRHK